MKSHFASSIALLALALSTSCARAALSPGDAAPAFSTPASLDGRTFTFSLAEALTRGPVVVYFYPSAYTGGCNLEAHTFAVHHEEFAAAGASVVGVSLDDIGRLNAFSADPDYCAGKIPVASDVGGRVTRAYALAVRDAPARKDTRGQRSTMAWPSAAPSSSRPTAASPPRSTGCRPSRTWSGRWRR